MDTAIELEQWLRKEASERIQRANSRRSSAESNRNCTDDDREIGRQMAERMMGRKLPKTSKAQDEANARMEEHIASKLDQEAAMLLRFADFVHERNSTT